MKKLNLKAILIPTILITVMSCSFLHAQHRINLSIGSGMQIPFGDLGDDDILRGKIGPTVSLEFDFFIMERISLGIFLRADGYKPKGDIVRLSGHVINSDNVTVGQVGIAGRYFFSTETNLRPFGEIWYGGGWLNIEYKEGGGGGPSGGSAWGLGAGIQYEIVGNIGIIIDMLYNSYNKDDMSMPRISFGIALGLFI